MFLDPLWLLMIARAVLLAIWAQYRVQAAYQQATQVPCSLSGAEAARLILDSQGLHDVGIEETEGFLSDHYDPAARVLRLSPGVYRGHNMAAAGIAAHEAGHALQHATQYAPLVLRNLAVPAAAFGGNTSFILIILGALLQLPSLLWFGILAFGAVVAFQLINLPVEFDASARAKQQLAVLGLADQEQMEAVNDVLSAAAWTYVAATLQAILTLLYLLIRFGGVGQSDE